MAPTVLPRASKTEGSSGGYISSASLPSSLSGRRIASAFPLPVGFLRREEGMKAGSRPESCSFCASRWALPCSVAIATATAHEVFFAIRLCTCVRIAGRNPLMNLLIRSFAGIIPAHLFAKSERAWLYSSSVSVDFCERVRNSSRAFCNILSRA